MHSFKVCTKPNVTSTQAKEVFLLVFSPSLTFIVEPFPPVFIFVISSLVTGSNLTSSFPHPFQSPLKKLKLVKL